MGVEIERKYLVSDEVAANYMKQVREGLLQSHEIEQAYLTTDPVIRVRKSDDEYYMTYKGKGLMCREEYNLPLTKEAYDILLTKADGNIISKTRILIPFEKYTIELDVFKAPFDYIRMAEVEFENEEEANNFVAPDWFIEEVTDNREYHNSNMSRKNFS